MNDIQTTYLSFTEVCLQTGVAEETIIEIIEQGIVEPVGTSRGEWRFSPAMVLLTRKAVRLHDDLDVDWPGIALAIELLEKLDQLRQENRHLKQRLGRFMSG
ncbi:chaperone modulator CbpM [Endozoicomonas elysicola]|uniref:Chaperone modulatory protein CbpM n=1 Tax=Endozoicomonas elysicola TaxID=305900 RepID=A0A081K8R6_9GAMM|nr:chaperone modulator CbpM [Endozoicomonas elysicola]KEI70542.1 chaperone modulatory protein CbpM [Endozoicomonas elysicola]